MAALPSTVRITFTRSAGATTLVGGLLTLVGNLLHPRYPDDPDVEIYRKIADSTLFAVADVILIIGVALVVAGLVAVSTTFAEDFLARSARLAVIAGGTVALLQLGVELYGVRQQAKIFVDSNDTDRVSSFWATSALDHVSSAMFATFTVLLLGVAPLLYGLAMRRASHRYPSWLGPLGALGGAVCIVVGFMNLLTSDQGDNEIPFLIGSLLVTAWVLVTGAQLMRPDKRPAQPTPSTDRGVSSG